MLSHPFFSRVVDDKNWYELLLPEVLHPKVVVRKIGGVFQDPNWQIITEEQALLCCEKAGQVILKPSVDTYGGKGVLKWSKGTDQEEVLLNYLSKHDNVIVQEIVEQHPALSYLHKDSINTIRIITLIHKDEVLVLSALLRMGANGSFVDNVTSGGVYVGIRPDGRLNEMALDGMKNKCTSHPQGAVFKDYEIPGFDKCCEVAKQSAPRFMKISKLIAWDFSVDTQTRPVLIELNLSMAGAESMQLVSGPLFGNGKLKEEIIKEALSYHKSAKSCSFI